MDFNKKELERTNRAISEGNKSISTSNNSGSYIASAVAYSDPEAEEFAMLMNEDPTEHKMKTTKILNSLFDNDPTSKESIVMIENKSDCNIIMRIEGVGNRDYWSDRNWEFRNLWKWRSKRGFNKSYSR